MSGRVAVSWFWQRNPMTVPHPKLEPEIPWDVRLPESSVLFITVDSCRYDTFVSASTPNMSAVGPIHKAWAPSYFTFGSHAAMFVGFTPGDAEVEQQYLNPKYGKVFRLVDAGFVGKQNDGFQLCGENIIAGFSNLGYVTLGSGAVGWFDPATLSGQVLGKPFDHFYFTANNYSLGSQLAWAREQVAAAGGRPVFLFLNIGETHVPYYFEGAPWSPADNPCIPFQKVNRAEDCRLRQTACVEFVDRSLRSLLDAFQNSSILICGDHGDCWGEGGLWEHGMSHDMTLTVPLILRVRGRPVIKERH